MNRNKARKDRIELTPFHSVVVPGDSLSYEGVGKGVLMVRVISQANTLRGKGRQEVGASRAFE